jgi:hypothetical protein
MESSWRAKRDSSGSNAARAMTPKLPAIVFSADMGG